MTFNGHTKLASNLLSATPHDGKAGSETVTQVVMDDTLPGRPREKTIIYQAPWVRCDREKDYEIAWKHFEERFAERDCE